MIYFSSFKLSDRSVKNPNIYPYNVFRRKIGIRLYLHQSPCYMEIMVLENLLF